MPSFISPTLIAHLVLIFIIFNVLVLASAFMVWMERKVCAYIQDREGPNRVGPAGLLQPFADVIKLRLQGGPAADGRRRPDLRDRARSSRPRPRSRRSRSCRSAARSTLFGLLDEPIRLQVTDVNVAVLVIFAVTSMGIYGIVLAGWSSNSKYSLLGGLRSSAQMISYELSYGLALAAVVMLAGSLSLREIVINQSGYWWYVIPKWYIFLQPLGFLIYMTAGVAETNRAPFDFPEAEQELVAGLPHGVQQHELRAVLHGRVHQHGHRLGGGDQPVSRRLARARSCRSGSAGSGS